MLFENIFLIKKKKNNFYSSDEITCEHFYWIHGNDSFPVPLKFQYVKRFVFVTVFFFKLLVHGKISQDNNVIFPMHGSLKYFPENASALESLEKIGES